MDEKDKKIIEALRQDSRQSIREIAKKTNIRPSTVHQRIMRLVSDGIIQKFTVHLDDKKVKESFIGFILVESKKEILNSFFANKSIKEVFGITGEYDLLLKLKCEDVDAFNRFLLELRKNPAIGKTLTMVGTVKIKEEI